MDTQKSQVQERLKQATNILVTVSSNPSVDQLSAAIGLTLILNKLGKHATAVFSGEVPSTMEFLQPEKTLEKTTDSLRDFIIALDKTKADKLRYKVEDQVVKIFITPYRTSISDKDLEFSHGDFNVEVVVALGVLEQSELDQAITAHGRILHDATVISLGTQEGGSLGSINWNDTAASSLCEMVVGLGLALKPDALDAQMATALLTGIVAETARFSNEKTSSETMQVSSKLMAAGANQQLVASQLQNHAEQPVQQTQSEPAASEEPEAELPEVVEESIPVAEPPAPTEPEEPAQETTPSSADGSLLIDHGDGRAVENEESSESNEPEVEQIHIDDDGILKSAKELDAMKQKIVQPLPPAPDPSATTSDTEEPQADSRLILEPPTLGGKLTANSEPEALDPSTDPLGATTPTGPILTHEESTPPDTFDTLPKSPDTLSDLEKAVASPHVQAAAPATPAEDELNNARDLVTQAVIGSTPQVLEPVQALNAQPMDLNLGQQLATPPQIVDTPAVTPPVTVPAVDTTPSDPGLPPGLVPPDPGLPADNTATSVTNATAPPPVPPPMMPPPPLMPPTPQPPKPADTAL